MLERKGIMRLVRLRKVEKFNNVLEKAKDACTNAGEEPDYHFPRVGKMIALAKGAQREIDDYMLTAMPVTSSPRTVTRENRK